MKIAGITHPDYNEESQYFRKWRLTYKGGDDFIEAYLKPFSQREKAIEFIKRRELSYVPAYAKSALIDVKNSIHQRMADVARKGGSKIWNQAIMGMDGGVDYKGNSLNSFMGNIILDELLPMRRVGIFIDRDHVKNKAEARKSRPYLYTYRTEDIRSWDYDKQNKLTSLLLRNYQYEKNEYGLPGKSIETYMHYRLTPDGVILDAYDNKSKLEYTITSDLTRIPFVMVELSQSLLIDIADYQIAALNLASGDLNYAQKSNYPFYTEMYDPATEMFARQSFDLDKDILGKNSLDKGKDFKSREDGTAERAAEADIKQTDVGATQGRRYPMGTERPQFINPSPDPLRVSMEKQEVLKREVRELINLNLSSLRSIRESADSKREDSKGKEEGLSNIGLELEHAERMICEIWSEYEKSEVPSVSYPANYSLKSDLDRRQEANELSEQATKINSPTYRKEMAKEAVSLLMGHKVPRATIDKIYTEIDSNAITHIDPEEIRADHESGLVSTVTASKARGYPDGEAEQAKIDHAEKLARISMAQGGIETSSGGEGLRDARMERDEEKSIDPNAQRGEGK